MRVKTQLWFLLISMALVLTGCGAGSLSSIVSSSGPALASLTSITVTPGSQTIAAGSKEQFKATGNYSDHTTKDLTSSVAWKSSAAGVASINSTGLVTALAAGQTTITATLKSVNGSAALIATDSLVSMFIKSSGSNVNVGSSLQLTAMGTFQDGKPASPLSDVTWSSSDNTNASVTNAGLVSGLHGGTATVTAKSGALSADLQLSVSAVLKKISLNPVGAAVLIGGHQQFSAVGFYNDGTTQDLTTTGTWTSSNLSKVSVLHGLANGLAVGAANLTISQSGVSNVTALNVVSSVYANLLGNYAFTLSTTDARGPASYAGSINFDGNGGVTGIEDSNTISGIQQQVPVTGTYILYPDGRGNVTFNANASHPAGITLRFFLASSAATGSLIQFDGQGTARGTLIQQNPAAFNAAAIHGTYVFRAAGVDTRISNVNGPAGITAIGMFSADGSGNISGGVDDVNDYGVVNGQNPLSASTYSVDTNGRGTLQLTDGSGTSNYAVYVVDSTRINFLQIDPDPSTAVLGLADLQTAQSYGTVAGTFAYLIDQPVVVQPNIPQTVVQEGQLGDLTLVSPSVVAGVLNNDTVNGSFINDYGAVNGRGQISTCGNGQSCSEPTDQHIYFYYMVSPTQMLIMQAFAFSNYPQFRPAVGEARLIAQAPYSVSSIQGNYVLQAHDGNSFADALMLMNFDGGGNLWGIVDQDAVGTISSTLIAAPQYILTPTQNGDTVLQLTTPGGTQNYYMYLFSNSGAYLGGVSTPLDGSFTQQ